MQSADSIGTTEDSGEGLMVEARVGGGSHGTGAASGKNAASKGEGDAVADERIDEACGVTGLEDAVDHRRTGTEINGGGGE